MLQLNQDQLHNMYVNNSYIVSKIQPNDSEFQGYLIQESQWISGGDDGKPRYYEENVLFFKKEEDILEIINPVYFDKMEYKVKVKPIKNN